MLRWIKGLAGAGCLMALTLAPAAGDYGKAMPAVVQKLTEMYNPARVPAAAVPSHQGDPLGHLLALQKRHWAPAWVTSTFYDWRTVSKYRRQAGLHLGYDIALPSGTAVSSAWAGTVIAVVPWTSSEWGVTVRSPDGTEVTYGHVTPVAFPGQNVSVGQVIGRVASDHVDVKMRDKLGRYVPFGENGTGGLEVAYPSAPRADRNSILTAWLVARSSAEQADEDLFLAENAAQKWELERRSAERRIETLDRTLEHLGSDQADGLISRKKLEELKAERAEARRLLAEIEKKERATPRQMRENRRVSKANLQAVESWARSEGLSWNDVENLIARTLKLDKNLREKVESGLAVDDGTGLTLLAAKKKIGAARLAQLEELYAAGGLSKQEIEDERLRQRLLEEEYDLLKRRKSQ